MFFFCSCENMNSTTCEFCDEQIEDMLTTIFVHDHPDSDAREVNLHENCQEDFTSLGEFPYVECEECDRLVCYRNPRNGWDVQFRNHPRKKNRGDVCVSCYKDIVLRKGQKEKDFVDDSERIHGGVFFSHSDLEQAGFVSDPDFTHFHVRCGNDAEKFNNQAANRIAEGKKVVVDWGSMAIGGFEGYISLFVKSEDGAAEDGAEDKKLRAELPKIGKQQKRVRQPTRIQPIRKCKK